MHIGHIIYSLEDVKELIANDEIYNDLRKQNN